MSLPHRVCPNDTNGREQAVSMAQTVIQMKCDAGD